ncbi:MAG: hypothetical protein JW748_10865 [Anaerolineales bacterium]|nr:hypothetical protein [Anaerolineales bacterium]
MPYRFALDRPVYSDLASGKVLLAARGHPAFPIRLASEIFQRCMAVREGSGLTGPVRLGDPCCGAAYHLAVLGLLHRASIRAIIASDIDPDVIPLAEKNLAMLSAAGIDRRREELAAMHREFGKPSHAEALAAADRLRSVVIAQSEPPGVCVFTADALAACDSSHAISAVPVDIVFTDVPYGRHSRWQAQTAECSNPMERLLENLLPALHPGGLVAVVSDKQQKTLHDRYDRIEKFRIGKRMAVILRPNF